MLKMRLLRQLEIPMHDYLPTRVATGADVASQRLWRASRISFPTLLILVGMFALFWPTAVRAGTVYLNQISGYYNPVGGGPFVATVVTPFGDFKTGDTFDTFCIEYTEEFYPGVTYEVNISDHAMFGHNGPPHGDPLTSQTAWLYATFRAGGLTTQLASLPYQWTGSAGDLYALQDAIWVTQGWTSPPIPVFTPGATGDGGLETELVNLADAKTKADPNNLYGVQVMQMWDPGHVGQAGFAHQDQLILVPAPTAAAGGLLLIVSALGLHYVKRRRHSAEI